MRTLVAIMILSGLAAPAAAQTVSANPAMAAPIASPFQALGNIIRNPDAPPPPPPPQVTSQPPLPTIIPPNSAGTYRGW